jgi:excisionase family DNA binding protein
MVVSADAAKCSPSTDALLTPAGTTIEDALDKLPDDRLLAPAAAAALLGLHKRELYAACDQGHLAFVMLQGTVQIEGRDLKDWARSRG